MRLVIETDQTRVSVVDELERLLEHGTLAVRLDAVTPLLERVRAAAQAVTPEDASIREANPERMAALAQLIVSVSGAAARLAAAADPNDPDAIAVKTALLALNITPG